MRKVPLVLILISLVCMLTAQSLTPEQQQRLDDVREGRIVIPSSRAALESGLISEPTMPTTNMITNHPRNPIENFPFEEGFENAFPPAGWTTIDNDGDGYNWYRGVVPSHSANTGTGSAVSASWMASGIGVLFPDNWLITPQLVFPVGSEMVLRWFTAAQDYEYPEDHYGVFISTAGNSVSDFVTTPLFTETLFTDDWLLREIDLSAYAGESVYIAFRHYNSPDMFQMKIDDVWVGEKADIPVLVADFDAPYMQDFDNAASLGDIKWSNSNFGLSTSRGVDGTPCVSVNMYDDWIWGTVLRGTATSPFIGNINATTDLSFEYRIVNWSGGTPAPATHATIRVMVSVGYGPFNTIHTIDHTNHIPSADFATVSVPLGDFAGDIIKVRFRADLVDLNGDLWVDVDNFKVLSDGGTLNVTLSSFSASATANETVNIAWTTESETNVRGFTIIRGENDDVSTGSTISNMLDPTNTTITQHYVFEDKNVEKDVEYYYWLRITFNDGSSLDSESSIIMIESEDIPILPSETSLSNVYPNPMKAGDSAQFGVSVRENETAKLQIFNIRGQIVHEFVDIKQGHHTLEWDGRDRNNRNVASGIYFYRLTSPSMHSVQRMVVIK